MKEIKRVINEHGNLTVGAHSIDANGILIIDADGDSILSGTQLSFNQGTQTLTDQEGTVIASNIQDITFVEGPNNEHDIGITDGMVLIMIHMESRGAETTLKGGVSIER